MREMKDSGIPWIGKIPKNWGICPLKYLCSYNNETLPENTNGEYEFDYVDIGSVTYGKGIGNYQHLKFSKAPSRARRLVKTGDIILSTVRTYLKATAQIPENVYPIVVSTGYLTLRANKQIIPNFLKYSVQQDAFISEIEAKSSGVSYPAINASEAVRTGVIVPPIEDQQRIADYLDTKCARIDSIRKNVEAEIEALKQYKKSVITEAVTKGLDKNVEMKDSGVEWIGKIPKHWEVYKVKYATSLIGSGTTPKSYILEYYDGDIPWIQSGDLYRREYITSTLTTVTEKALRDNSTLTLYEPPYLVIAMYGASIGNCAISNIRACVNQACCVLKINSQNSLHFLKYWFILSQDNFIQKAVGGGQPNISQIKIKQHFFVKVPIKEQNKIVKFLDSKCSEIDAIIASKQKQLEVLSDYKKSLIYEVVTGKKEVPLHE